MNIEIKNLMNDLNPSNSIQRQLFALNSMSTNELKLKWLELYKTPALNFKKGFLIKAIAYKIQMLAGLSNVSQEELKLSLDIAKDRLKISGKGSLLNRQVNIIPPAGSVIKTFYKGNEYIVKVIDNNGSNNSKFEYNGRILLLQTYLCKMFSIVINFKTIIIPRFNFDIFYICL